MTAASIFSIANGVAFLAWVFLIAGARWLPRTFRGVRYLVPLLFAGVYIVCFAIAEPVEGAGFRTIDQVRNLFTSDWNLLAGWLHYLAFDFFVGCWILEKSKSERIPHWLIIIPLIFTFLLGPIGLVMFLAVFGWRKRSKKSVSI